jgi:hypothetical protein
MAIFNVGDKVRIIIAEDDDKTGIIVAKGQIQHTGLYKIALGKPIERIGKLSFWKVKVDGKDEEQEFPSDKLEKVE